jgi:hypothetical protein
MMLNQLNWLDISIGNCNYRLTQAEDNKDLDSFNYWFAERERLYRERAKLLDIKLGVV